jgi:circadian clock protein KaiB
MTKPDLTNKVPDQEKLILQLFVAGMTSKSMQAIENIKRICDIHLPDRYELEIVDVYKHPEVALAQQIVFCPSLIKRFPLPQKVLVGNLSNTEKVIKGLGIIIKEA